MRLSSLRRDATLALSLCALAASFAVSAQEWKPGSPGVWGLGIGAGVERLPYTGIDANSRLVPLLTYDSEYFRFSGLSADWKFARTEPFTFALRGKYGLGDGYEADDAPILAGMDERKGSFWLGVAATWNADFAKLSFEVLSDVSGHSKGTRARLGIERNFTAGRFVLTPRASVLWTDRKYVDYYYGVTGAEATASRAAYDRQPAGQPADGLHAGRTPVALPRRQRHGAGQGDQGQPAGRQERDSGRCHGLSLPLLNARGRRLGVAARCRDP